MSHCIPHTLQNETLPAKATIYDAKYLKHSASSYVCDSKWNFHVIYTHVAKASMHKSLRTHCNCIRIYLFARVGDES